MALEAGNSEQPGPDQLDALLEEASALAEDLSMEIAGEDPFFGISDAEPAGDASVEQDGGIPDVVEQLESVDELISEAQSAIGKKAATDSADEMSTSSDDIPDFMQASTESKASETEPAVSDEQTPDASADAIPDFMQEFTQPADDESSDGVPQAQGSAVSTSLDDIPDFMSDLTTSENEQAVSQESFSSVALDASPKLGQVGTSFDDASEAHSSETQSSSKVQSLGSRIPRWIPLHLIQRIPVALIRERIMAMSMKLAEKGVELLELVDQPTQRLGYKPRQLIGLVAISTLGTAFVVFVISIF